MSQHHQSLLNQSLLHSLKTNEQDSIDQLYVNSVIAGIRETSAQENRGQLWESLHRSLLQLKGKMHNVVVCNLIVRVYFSFNFISLFICLLVYNSQAFTTNPKQIQNSCHSPTLQFSFFFFFYFTKQQTTTLQLKQHQEQHSKLWLACLMVVDMI